MLEPIVITPLAQWIAAAFCVGAAIGFVIGWIRGLCEAEDHYTERDAKADKQEDQQCTSARES